MCGIAGMLGRTDGLGSITDAVKQMTDVLHHRGPDGAGLWVNAEGSVGLGHRRLAIVDLAQTGHQPMISASGRFVISFNGEIYNFRDLRVELEKDGHVFRGHSDTEVMLTSFERWGVDGAIARFNGMFAFAVWDERNRMLQLVRDRVGKKPLYYGVLGSTLVFASELKAFRALRFFDRTVDRDALCQFLRHGYVPSPRSIYRGIAKLEQGSVARFRLDERGVVSCGTESYWNPVQRLTAARSSLLKLTESEAAESFERLLSDATRIRMIADVPIGAFLSGGLDSSIVVAMMQRLSCTSVRTFSIGFDQADYDEAGHAKAVATHLGTDHTEVYVTGKDALDVIPSLSQVYDEPFADSSQVPTFLISQITRRYVTVALSGDGGDEALLGYNRYLSARDLWARLRHVPLPIRHAAGSLLRAVPSHSWDQMAKLVLPMLPASMRHRAIGDRMHKLAGILDFTDARDLYLSFVSHWTDPDFAVVGGKEPASAVHAAMDVGSVEEFVIRMAFLDMATYLPDDILVKVDRASMAASLEVRAPLLDYRILEFAAALPYNMKLRKRQGKWLLRQVLYRHVPRHLVDRPKTGFGVPLDTWLRGPLRDWAEGLLEKSRLSREGFFRPDVIRRKWEEHVHGGCQWQHQLWSILMFQAWYESQS